MKVVIHIGMHKTGSSSIQNALAALEDPPFTYAPWRSPNHSAWFVLLFEKVERLTSYHSFRNAGRDLDELLAERRKYTALLEEALAANSELPLLISAEAISGKFDDAAQSLADFLLPRCSAISVFGYVRRPVSFMQSAFQQRLKGGGKQELNAVSVWPNYRNRFEKIDRLFGRENVSLTLFDPARLAGADVVTDFCKRIGVPAPDVATARANESLSLEATALLFVQRKFGAGLVGGHINANRANHAFFERLSQIGTGKLQFSPAFVASALKKFSSDLDWINQRLGESVVDAPKTTGRLISGSDDLVEIALENAAPLADLLGIRRSIPATLDSLLADLEDLRLQTAKRFAPQ